MMTRAAFLTVLFALILPLAPAQAAEAAPLDPAKRESIRKLMEVTNASAMGLQLMRVMRPMMSSQLLNTYPRMPEAAQKIWLDEMESAFRRGVGELTNRMIPVYGQEFTHEEIKGLIQFYNTELGRKALASMPRIMKQSSQVGMRWGMEIGSNAGLDAMRKVRAAGFDPKTFR